MYAMCIGKTLALISIPENLESADDNAQFWKDEIEEVENKSDNYFMIETLDSNQAFRIMASLADSLQATVVAIKYLLIALNNRKPNAGFNAIIRNKEESINAWFAYKMQWIIEYIKEFIEIEEQNNK